MTKHIELEDVVGNPSLICCGSPMKPHTLIREDGSKEVYSCSRCRRLAHQMERKPGIQGAVCVELIDPKTMKVVERREDHNIFTDVGRNWLASLISYYLFTVAPGTDEPATSKRRYDGVRYMMVGTGSQLETVAVTQLVTPVVFDAGGNYLANVIAPNVLPGSGISAQFQKIYGLNEISLPATVYITEVGLFPSGPASNPLDPAISTHAPIAYKTFDAVPKTTSFLLSVTWEIKF